MRKVPFFSEARFEAENRHTARTSVDEAICRGERPEPVDDTFSPAYKNLMVQCWNQDTSCRPSFKDIVDSLEEQFDKVHSETGGAYVQSLALRSFT